MTKRETRVINAFINCVKTGEFTEDYAITLIEDNQRYGWLTETAKDAFYDALDRLAEEAAALEAAKTAAQAAQTAPGAPNFAPDDADEEPMDGGESTTGEESAVTDEAQDDAPERETPMEEPETTDSEE